MSEKITASLTVADETITTELNTAARGATGATGADGADGSGGDALVADPLSQFAATTSAQLAGVLTDETGTGSSVFATSPTLTSPVLNTGVSGTAILDEDDLASDSDTQLATQQSIKAYVDDAIKAVTITAKVNEAGGITKGQVVFISGATGGFPQVSLADNTDFAKSDVLAVATETKTNGQNIAITLSGLVENIDTSAYTEGAILYLGTSGNITETHPTGINAVQRIGHAVKINASTGSILVELDGLTVINDHDGIMRHQIVNQNAGTSASAAYTIVNDAAYRSSLSMVGSNYAVVAGISNSLIIYNEGYNKTVNAVDGNYGFEWWTDETDSHNLTSTSKMSLTADGELHTLCQTIDHTATEADDHALEIDCDAAGFGDVKAIDVAYDTGAITTGQDEAVILVNIDESAATGGDVTALEVLATEGSANINGMLTGVGVHPIEQLSGVFSDMDSALVNATDRLTEFTTAGSDVQMFVADNDTVTIGSSAKFEEIEFLLAITANLSIRPDFEFSTGSGTWTTFTPVDGTNGMRNTGVIAWLDGDIPTWAVGTGSEYLIRITRQRNTLSTPPTESKVQIAAATEYKWDKDGDLSVNSVTATGNVTGSNLSGTNTGDETDSSIATIITAASSKTTPVDADAVPITDSAASNGLKKLTFANLKTWVQGVINANRIQKMVATVETVTNSTVATASTELQIPLAIGTWWLEYDIRILSSDYGAAGTRAELGFTGTSTVDGSIVEKIYDATTTFTGKIYQADFSITSINAQIFNRVTRSAAHRARVKVDVTVAGTISVKFCQSVAVAAENVELQVGSYLFATKL